MYIRALQGREEALGPDHTSTLHTVNNLGTLYAKQGKLAEAEKMYIRALQGYEDALGPKLVSPYLPALNTMFAFGDLFSQTDRKDMAKFMYDRALSGYVTVQGPSSEICAEIQDRLQALQLMLAQTEAEHAPAETEMQNMPIKREAPEHKSRLQRLFRKLKS
jgi:tetratricopeptide (TPR) repeat protein